MQAYFIAAPPFHEDAGGNPVTRCTIRGDSYPEEFGHDAGDDGAEADKEIH